ncbi:hypothetical protein Trydic_g12272 [Trypoxylus dichotomus]
MEKWNNKVALVSGASSGIGAATAKALVRSGMKVVGTARRVERVQELANSLSDQSGKLYAFKADWTKEEDILRAFEWTKDNLGPVSVLINNAGVGSNGFLYNGDTNAWRSILDTNVMSVAIASREAIKTMNECNIDGYIVNINSVLGHEALDMPGVNMYIGSKFAVTGMTETLRNELAHLGSNIRVSSLSPGFVKTEIPVTSKMITEEAYKRVKEVAPALESEDIADAVLYMLSTPLHVQVTELTIRPIREVGALFLQDK